MPREDDFEGVFIAPDTDLPGVGIDRPRMDDAIYQDPPTASANAYVMAEDGLPKPNAPPNMPFAPPLTEATLVCMEDKSSFVIRDHLGRVILTVPSSRVERMPNGHYVVTPAHLVELMQTTSVRREVLERYWMPGAWLLSQLPSALLQMALESRYEYLSVEPIRPVCIHYARQMADLQDSTDNIMVERLCTARKTNEGIYLSVSNAQMFACELREPRDGQSCERLDSFDDEKIRLGRERLEKGEAFDIDAALNYENAQDPAEGGIFR